MNRHAAAGNDQANSQSHHELLEQMGQLVDRERLLRCENDQLRAQLVEMKEQEKKKYDDLMVQYNMKREYDDDGLDKQGTSTNQVTVKTEWDDDEVKQEIKEEYEEDHDIFIKQEYVPAYIKTESNDEDVKEIIKQEIKEEYDEDDDYGCERGVVKNEEVSDDDNSMQIDEVISPNLAEPEDIVSRDQVNRPMQSVFELSPSANCQMQLTNSSQIEQSVDQQVDKADHEPNEPANHGHNQWPTTKQSQSRTRKRTAMTSGQVSTNGPITNSKRTRVSASLDRLLNTEQLSSGSRVDLSESDNQNGIDSSGEGENVVEQNEDDETELGEEDQGGHYKIEIVKLKCTEDGCEDEVASRDELNDHFRVIHHISPHRCLAEGCNERFEQWIELGNHVQHNHSNISTWPCPHCTKTFNTHTLVYNHLYNYHFEGQFKCGYDGCHYDRVATLRSEIRNHQLSVHPKTTDSTIFTCQFNNCGKSFNKKYNFNNHQRIHQKVKPYKCTWNMCDYASTHQSAVIKHIRTKHFHLPETQKKQQQLGIEDNRNPRDYLQHEHNSQV